MTVGDGKAADVWSVDYQVSYDQGKKICQLTGVSVKAENKTGSLTIAYPTTMTLIEPALPAGWTEDLKEEAEQTKEGMRMVAYEIPKTATDSQVQSFLSKLKFTSTNQGKGAIRVWIDAGIHATVPYEHEDGSQHYYRFVEFEEGQERSFSNAYEAAKRATFRGYQGYLATLTSKREHDMVFDSIASKPGYLGAMRLVDAEGKRPKLDQDTIEVDKLIFATTVAGKETPWYWVSGPEAGDEFCTDPVRIGSGSGDWVDAEAYHGPKDQKHFNFWSSKEPSNSKYDAEKDEMTDPRERRGEGVMQFAFNDSERWNDIGLYGCYYNETWNKESGSKSNYVVAGYYVEFGGYKGEDPPENGTAYATATREWSEPDKEDQGQGDDEKAPPMDKNAAITYEYGKGNLTKAALLSLIQNADGDVYERIKDATVNGKSLHQVNEAIRRHKKGTYTVTYLTKDGSEVQVQVKLVGSEMTAKEKTLQAVLGQAMSVEDLVNGSGLLVRDANGRILDPSGYTANADELAELNRAIRLGLQGTYRVTLYAPDGTPYVIQVTVPEGEVAVDDEGDDPEEEIPAATTADPGSPGTWALIGLAAVILALLMKFSERPANRAES